jgi:hypothetical protein
MQPPVFIVPGERIELSWVMHPLDFEGSDSLGQVA